MQMNKIFYTKTVRQAPKKQDTKFAQQGMRISKIIFLNKKEPSLKCSKKIEKYNFLNFQILISIIILKGIGFAFIL